jgi:hypothetical protein
MKMSWSLERVLHGRVAHLAGTCFTHGFARHTALGLRQGAQAIEVDLGAAVEAQPVLARIQALQGRADFGQLLTLVIGQGQINFALGTVRHRVIGVLQQNVARMLHT